MISKKIKIILIFSLILFLGSGFSFAANDSSSSNDNLNSNDNTLKTTSSTNSSSKILAAGDSGKITRLSQNLILSSSGSVKNYVEKYKKLPSYVVISNEKYSMPEYMHLLSKSIAYKCLKSTNTVNIKFNANNPSKPVGHSIKKSFSKNSYYTMAKKTCLYIEKYNKVPNYVTTTSGKVQYQTMVYGFAKIGNYIRATGKLPTSLALNVKNSHSLNKYIPKYTRKTTSTPPSTSNNSSTNGNTNTGGNSNVIAGNNKNAVWVHSGDMKNVNLDTLVNNGIGNIFIHEGIFKDKTSALNWISTATNKGLKIHIWFTCFYNASSKKWTNPINTNTKTYNQAYFNTIISRAKEYASYSGVAGIHLDYLRYPGSDKVSPGPAYKYSYSNGVTGVNAVTEFTRQLSTSVKSINNKIILSAAIMPESENIKYYGQDSAQLGKYLDVLCPMIYKSNYGKTTSWIKTTTQMFVKNSGNAEIWTALQTYKSDSSPVKLSSSELLTDCKSALSGGATGIALFRWGIVNLFNLSNI